MDLQLTIFQTMLEDKLKATDWEATNEAIEEQIARESYIQYIRDMERRKNLQIPSTSSTSASTSKASPRSSRRGSLSPKGGQSPKAASSKYSSMSSPMCEYLCVPVYLYTFCFCCLQFQSSFCFKFIFDSQKHDCTQ